MFSCTGSWRYLLQLCPVRLMMVMIMVMMRDLIVVCSFLLKSRKGGRH